MSSDPHGKCAKLGLTPVHPIIDLFNFNYRIMPNSTSLGINFVIFHVTTTMHVGWLLEQAQRDFRTRLRWRFNENVISFFPNLSALHLRLLQRCGTVGLEMLPEMCFVWLTMLFTNCSCSQLSAIHYEDLYFWSLCLLLPRSHSWWTTEPHYSDYFERLSNAKWSGIIRLF